MKIRGLLVGILSVASLSMISCSWAENSKKEQIKLIEENGTTYETKCGELLDIRENKDTKEVVANVKCNGKVLIGSVKPDKDLLIGSTMEDIKKLAISVDTTKFETLDVWVVNHEDEHVLSVTINKDILERLQSGDLKYVSDIEDAVEKELWTK